jgi:DNA-binding transcriptional LysR family regulator
MREEFHYPDARFICAVKENHEIKDLVRVLGLGPNSLNMYIKRIEDRLGKTIFVRERKQKTIGLNEEGLALYPLCKQMIDLMATIDSVASNSNDILNGEVVLTGPQTVLENFCLPYFVDFVAINPRLNVCIKQMDSMFYNGQKVNEFYFTSDIKDDEDTYQYFPYHDFVQMLWASKGYLEKHGKIETIEDLYRHTLLFQCGYFSNDKAMGIPQKVRTSIAYNEIKTFEITGCSAINYLCEQGLGIMSGSFETTMLSKVKVERILENLTGENIRIHLKVNKKFMNRRIAKILINWIFECRDRALKTIDMKPLYEFKPFEVKIPGKEKGG